jgi:hypothetical protein
LQADPEHQCAGDAHEAAARDRSRRAEAVGERARDTAASARDSSIDRVCVANRTARDGCGSRDTAGEEPDTDYLERRVSTAMSK